MKLIFLLSVFAFVFIGCSNKSNTDYLKSAEENLKNGKAQEAVNDLENFIKENRTSEKAPEALFNLAKIYQNRMLVNISEKESLEKAAKIYRQVFDDYPNSKKAPEALFMSAFIFANDLNKLHPAEMSYKLFLEKFPNHELAVSAREELNNLGLSPEEILKRKTAPNI